MNTMQQLLQRPSVRYVIVGGSVYVLELIIIVVAQGLGRTPVQAVAISFTIGLVVSFLLQKLFTFGDKRTHHRILLTQIIAVSLLVLINFGFSLLVTSLLQHHTPAVVSRTLALGITTIWNFYLYRTRIFTPSDTPPVY